MGRAVFPEYMQRPCCGNCGHHRITHCGVSKQKVSNSDVCDQDQWVAADWLKKEEVDELLSNVRPKGVA